MPQELRDVRRPSQNPLNPVDPKIEQYLGSQLAKHDEAVLLEMEQLAKEQHFPIVGRNVGAFLEVLALSIGAQRIFEFGSGYGYSAYWFSRTVGAGGKVICTDGSARDAELAKQFLSRVNRMDRIEFHVGLAQDTFQKTQGVFDIIYNDVDKGDYPQVWEMAKSRIRPGGFYIADNVLWGGRVALPPSTSDVVPGWTEAILIHNRTIFADPEFDAYINPTRDGVLVARRKTRSL